MALHNEKMREIVLLLLFGLTSHNQNEEKNLQDLIMQELKVSRSSVREAFLKARLVVESLPVLDGLISEVALSFSLERIQAVELAILRLAFFELFIEKKLHPKVVLGETSRLLKKFSTQEAVSFVHALLLKACQQHSLPT